MGGHHEIEFAGLTDVGIRRSHNQDSLAILPAADKAQWQLRGCFFLVADGMGAHAVGELASKLAADTIPHVYSKHAQDGPAQALRRAFLETNGTIHTRGQQNREFEGMGTTSSALLIRPEGAWIGHVGDSRVYRIRDGQMEQLSFDHSLVWEMARRQKCSPEELQGIPPNVIVRSLGPEPLVQVDVEGPHSVRPGDIFVLCSDGLSGPLTDREIGAVASVLPPQEACQLLIDLANLHGGPDNITVIVVRVGTTSGGRTDAGEGRKDPSPGGKGRAWYEAVPWPLWPLFGAIALAVIAILLHVNGRPGGVLVFLLAALSLLAGLVGLMWPDGRAKAPGPAEIPHSSRPPQVYRRSSCQIDTALLQKVQKALALLEERIRENNWAADWGEYQKHHHQAEDLTRQDDLTGAFAASCRAMRILTETLHKQRNKEEVFQPIWERKSAQKS